MTHVTEVTAGRPVVASRGRLVQSVCGNRCHHDGFRTHSQKLGMALGLMWLM